MSRTTNAVIGALALLTLPGLAEAAPITFSFDFRSTASVDQQVSSTGSPGQTTSRTFTATALDSNSQPVQLSVTATPHYYEPGSGTLSSGYNLGRYDHGLGVHNTSNQFEQHTVDNNGFYDYVEFEFSSPVAFEELSIYRFEDGDFSYSLLNDPTASQLLGDLTTVLAGGGAPFQISYSGFGSEESSQIRVMAAYEADSFGDQFKIQGLTVTVEEDTPPPPPAPEPGTLSLIASAIVGLGVVSRRRRRQA